MTCFNMIAETTENTVLAEYVPLERKSENYQSEAELEREFIRMLCEQGYSYLEIHSEPDLIENLRAQIERLNNYKFSDAGWKKFFNRVIANPSDDIVEKTRKIQQEEIWTHTSDDGKDVNIKLIDKSNVHNNCLQVINQYTVGKESGAKHANRYDVTILVNGLPLVHVELKRRGVALRTAFDQIGRYEYESFWAGCGLYNYVQIFVISNGTETKYYSNTTRKKSLDNSDIKGLSAKSFEFTNYWADAKNHAIPDLVDFARTFFARSALLNILTKYCVFTTEEDLKVMRPYQITATEKILNRIKIAECNKKFGTREAGGYIWHTTGSGKTLTSFKTAQLAMNLPYIDKVLFVVDRKDLDYQTMREYNKFQEGSANSSASTTVLEENLRKADQKIVITTIQKLSNLIKKYKYHDVYDKKVVMIFDECHRSQFGEMHRSIVKKFKKYCIFGFTGTPIFTVNAKLPNLAPVSRDKVTKRLRLDQADDPQLMTTESLFGERLHTYTIIDAINDKNVLPFRVDYLKTMEEKDDVKDEPVWDINREEALKAPERIALVTKYILEHFDQKTYRKRRSYDHKVLMNVEDVAKAKPGTVGEIEETHRVSGFNALFGVSSIEVAKLYYYEFKKQMAENPRLKLNIATIFSYAPNESEEENSESAENLPPTAKKFLDSAIADYNKDHKTDYSTDGEKFQNYYKDVSLRMKNKQLDLLIVVNMFLTGFDAPALNTLFVDKNLRMHGLIQAFSRTNRIYNSIKKYGNIVCFRNLQREVDEAIALFGNKEAGGVVLMRKFEDYYFGYDQDGKHHQGYVELVEELKKNFPLALFSGISTDEAKKEFILLFSAILRMRNLLSSFDEFDGKDTLAERDRQNYTSWYLKYRDDLTKKRPDPEPILDNLVFEIELIKQIEVDIAYILKQIEKYRDSHCEDWEIVVSVRSAIEASMELRSKKELIEEFLANLNGVFDVVEDWQKFAASERDKDLEKIIVSENLDRQKTRLFAENCFLIGEVRTTGTDIDELLPPMSRFEDGNKRAETKARVIEKLQSFYEKFSGIGGEFRADAPRAEFNFGTAPAGTILSSDFDSNLRAAEKNRE